MNTKKAINKVLLSDVDDTLNRFVDAWDQNAEAHKEDKKGDEIDFLVEVSLLIFDLEELRDQLLILNKSAIVSGKYYRSLEITDKLESEMEEGLI